MSSQGPKRTQEALLAAERVYTATSTPASCAAQCAFANPIRAQTYATHSGGCCHGLMFLGAAGCRVQQRVLCGTGNPHPTVYTNLQRKKAQGFTGPLTSTGTLRGQEALLAA